MIKLFFLFVFMVFLFPPESSGHEFTINAGWEFILDDDAGIQDVQQSEGWQIINIPHTWNKDDSLDDEPGKHRGAGWYRKSINIPSGERNNIFLRFEAANQHTWVYINGQQAGEHIGGYSAFVVDITDHVVFDEPNTLVVRVSNAHDPDIAPQSGDFTFFGGIYRDVWLVRRHNVFFDHLDGSVNGVYVNTPEVSHDKGVLQVRSYLANQSGERRNVRVEVTLYDNQTRPVGQVRSRRVRLSPAASDPVVLSLEVENPKLWSPESPVLYTAEVLLKDDRSGEVLDRRSIRRGFRWFEMDENNAFVLNGEVVKLMGVNRHQDHPGFGNALPDPVHRKDILKIREQGSNFLRLAHYPQDPAVLDACDELGLLVYEEIPLVNSITVSEAFNENSRNMMRQMIRQHYNHTSVVIWGISNEVLLWSQRRLDSDHAHMPREEYYEETRKLMVELNEISKKEDPERLTAIAHQGDYNMIEAAGLNNVADITAWNLYYGWYVGEFSELGGYLDRFHADYPHVGLMISEYGAGVDRRIRALDPVRFDFSVEWGTAYHTSYYNQVMERPFVMGAGVWAFADFNSVGRVDAIPNMNSKGLVNYDRSPKDSYLFFEAAFAKEPYLQIGSLDWDKRKGFANENGHLEHPVFVFSNQPEVMVFLNENPLGTFEIEDYQVRVMVPFENADNRLRVSTVNVNDQVRYIHAKVIPDDLTTLRPGEIDINMNLGSHFFFNDDIADQIWNPEQAYAPGTMGYVGGGVVYSHSWIGSRVGVDDPFGGTVNEPLYQTVRDSIEGFRADVPDGWYEVTLHFAEFYSEEEKEIQLYNLGSDIIDRPDYIQRVFTVTTHNGEVYTIEDLVDFQATELRFWARADNNQGIMLDFESRKGSAFLSAISIRGR